MQRFFYFIVFLFASVFVFGQTQPVKWAFDQKDLGSGEYELIFKATIDDGWVVYSQYLESDDGPVATAIEWFDGDYSKVGKAEESGHKKTAKDPVFDMVLSKFSKDMIITQKVKGKKAGAIVEGYLTFMTCNDMTCLPPTDIDFKFTLQPTKGTSGSVDNPKPKDDSKVATTPQTTTKEVASQAPVVAPVPPSTKKKASTNQPVADNSASKEVDNASGSSKIENAGNDTDGPLEPVKWSWKAEDIGDQQWELTFDATIDKGWYTYSTTENGDGPVPTSFEFTENGTPVGDIIESDNRMETFDQVFQQEVRKFKDYAQFKQVVKVDDRSKPVKGYFEFMACDDSKCLMPTFIDFEILAGSSQSTTGFVTADPDNPNSLGIMDTKLAITEEVMGGCNTTVKESNVGYWRTFIFGFLGGLVALLTPCVFPMIPLTVSFFTKGSGNRQKAIRQAIFFGISIVVIYTAMGMLITGIFGAQALNEMSTNAVFNVLFFIIFIVFALSFFGLFEITLPSSWVNQSDKAAERGGMLGIFFMAFTLSLVSFSCTGPIIGSLLVESVNGGSIGPVLGMLGFSLALAIPFALFAAFPGWLNSLPRSGSWMNNVKVTLGFIEVALAFKFLSVADMTSHWNLLKFEPFMVIWIICALGLALYHFGVIKFKLDGTKSPGMFRKLIGIVALGFAAYLTYGLVNYKSLPVLSGLAPPVCYRFVDPCECPIDLDCFHDFEEALAYAKQVDKPLFVDFTGYGCVNCRKMEENIWPKAEIKERLHEDYVVVSLYVDDKKPLNEGDNRKYFVDKTTGAKIRNVGNKWAYFQINNFGQNTQPLYVLMDNDGKTVLNSPVGYMPDEKEYLQFLDCGIQNFEVRQSERIGQQ